MYKFVYVGEGRQARDHSVYAERLGALSVCRTEPSRHGSGHSQTRYRACRWVPALSCHSASMCFSPVVSWIGLTFFIISNQLSLSLSV